MLSNDVLQFDYIIITSAHIYISIYIFSDLMYIYTKEAVDFVPDSQALGSLRVCCTPNFAPAHVARYLEKFQQCDGASGILSPSLREEAHLPPQPAGGCWTGARSRGCGGHRSPDHPT